MTVVYIDGVFLLNTLLNYLLLLATAKVVGEPLRRWRMGLGAVLGGGYAVAVFLPGLDFLAGNVWKLLVAVLMILLALGYARRLLRVTLVFFALACALGGGVMVIGLLGGQGLGLQQGVYYSVMDLKTLLLSAAVCYALLTLVFQRSASHDSRELVPAVLYLGEGRVQLTALVDTGNTLTDPVTGMGVMVVEGTCLLPLLPELKGVDLTNPVGALEQLAGRGQPFRLLPYQAVGTTCGMLLAIRMDRVQVGTQNRGSILVALSPNGLSDGGGYHALIGAQ